MRTTFAVGRVDGRSREVFWLRGRRDEAFPGPWRVRAVVGGPAPEAGPAPASPCGAPSSEDPRDGGGADGAHGGEGGRGETPERVDQVEHQVEQVELFR